MSSNEHDPNYDLTMMRAWARAGEFNAHHPLGTSVRYRPVKDSDEGMRETVTRSPAWALPSGETVVMVDGQAGGVAIDHVEVV